MPAAPDTTPCGRAALEQGCVAEMAAAEGSQHLVLPAARGAILDRNGKALAQSVDGLMVVADPQMTRTKAPELAVFLSEELDLDYFRTLDRLRRSDSRSSVHTRPPRSPSGRPAICFDSLASWKTADRGLVGSNSSRSATASHSARPM